MIKLCNYSLINEKGGRGEGTGARTEGGTAGRGTGW